MWKVGVEYHLCPLVQCALYCADVKKIILNSDI